MGKSFFKTASNYILSFFKYLDSKASIIVRKVINLNLYFLVTSLFLAVPGLYCLIQIL